jgi:hypothetical protein
MFASAEKFLAKYLGGRFQESMTPEVAERLKVITVDVKTVEKPKRAAAAAVGVPKMKYHPQVRILPLDGFEYVNFGLLWQGRRSAMLEAFFKICDTAARRLLEGEDPRLSLVK